MSGKMDGHFCGRLAPELIPGIRTTFARKAAANVFIDVNI
jgi:hypothetical protein